jgi:Zn-dependent metalloprotease
MAQLGYVQKEMTNGAVSFARFRTDSVPELLSNAMAILRDMHQMRQVDQWSQVEAIQDEQGGKHRYYQQYYKGIRVAYGNYSVHATGDIVNTALGDYHQVGDVDTDPAMTESQALEYALAHVGAEVYKWEIPEEEEWLNETFNESYVPNGELVIVKDHLQTDSIYRLAYLFDIYAHEPMSRNYIYVDAITGVILDKSSLIWDANAIGTASTRYSGTQSIVTDSYNGSYRLQETRNGVSIATYNMNKTGNYSCIDFTDANNSWTEYNNANMDNAGLDAHWGAEMTLDYFRQVHNRNSWNGTGGTLTGYVNGDLPQISGSGQTSSANAFWDGNKITYGYGDNFLPPFTTLDICAHEFGHGVTKKTANLKYQGESGAINESLSDIWAACVENSVSNLSSKQIWIIGEDLVFPLRSMSNPNLYNLPDTYQGLHWINPANLNNDNGGVHTNNGVGNFWFYLLSQGGTGTNDNDDTYSVTGIGIDKAAKIVYRTITVFLNSSSEQTLTYSTYRHATINAATSLYGSNSIEENAVTNAWYAVGIGGPVIAGPNNIDCYTNGTTYSAPFPSAVCNWTVSSNLQIVSGQGTNTIVVQPSSWSTHAATITVNGTTKQINIGVPNNLAIVRHDNSNGTITFELVPGLPISQCEYLWEETSSRSDYSYTVAADNYHATFQFFGTGVYNLKCTPWMCNVGTPATISITKSSMQYSASASGKQVVISSLEGSGNMLSSARSQVTYTLVYVVTGAVAASGQISSAGGTLNFGTLPAGIYILALDTGGDKPETFRIVLQ